MFNLRCRFHIVGTDSAFQTVTAVEAEMLGSGVQTFFYPCWSICQPLGIRDNDIVIGHISGTTGIELVRQFVQRFKHVGTTIPRIVIIADQLEMSEEIDLLKLRVTECLIRPLNLRRFSYLLQSLFVKSQSNVGTASATQSTYGKRLAARICKLGGVASNVLITGETGVGKSYCAKQLHLGSSRAKKPFVVVNCAAIPESLFESELFGHEKGAFTGADRKHIGKLEFAAEGTVFLDDVDAIPLNIQAKLLHAVESREFYPLGSNETAKFNARLLSATNRNLEALAAVGEFRSDLMYRLNTYELSVDPLRNRPEEIVDFVAEFVEQFAAENRRPAPEVHSDAMKMLLAYSWPGNIRELRNAIQSGAIDAEDQIIREENLPEKIRLTSSQPNFSHPNHEVSHSQLGVTVPFLDDVRRLIAALVRHNFNRTDAAEDLGYSRTTLYNKLDKLHLS